MVVLWSTMHSFHAIILAREYEVFASKLAEMSLKNMLYSVFSRRRQGEQAGCSGKHKASHNNQFVWKTASVIWIGPLFERDDIQK
jgi:hypothetical protein